jgi:TolB protein
LYRINPDGTGLIAIATAPEGKHFREVIYQPNGLGLVTILTGNTMKNRQIYTINTNGSNLQMLYHNDQYAIQGLAMHPDNNRLLFSMDMSGNESETGRMLNARIMELNISSGTLTDCSSLKDNGTNDLEAAYSPDGGKIIFTNGLNTATATTGVWIMYQDGRFRINIMPVGFNPFWFE